MKTAVEMWEAAKVAAEALSDCGGYTYIVLGAGMPSDVVHRFAAAAGVKVSKTLHLDEKEPPFVIEKAAARHAGINIEMQGSRPATADDTGTSDYCCEITTRHRQVGEAEVRSVLFTSMGAPL